MRLSVAGLGGLIFLSAIGRCWAQIAFSPDMLVLESEAGQTTAAEIQIKNEADKAKEIMVEIEYRRPGPCLARIQDWVSVTPGNLHLAKGESQKVRLELQGLNNQVKGECVLSLFAGERTESQIPLNVRIGMPVFVRLNRESRVAGKIAGVKQAYLKDGRLEITAEVKNIGVLHLAPYGIAWVENTEGTRLWQIELRPDQPIFSGETRSLTWQGQGPPYANLKLKLGVRLFWGTLYGMGKLGVPPSSEAKIPFQSLANSK